MKKMIYKGITCVVSLVVLSVIIIEGLIITEGAREPKEEVDYLIVLGARLYGDIPSPSLQERLKVAHRYLEEHDPIKVVVSGGQGADEDISEALAMKRYFLDQGISEGRIMMEDQSTNTFENLSFSLEKIRADDPSDPVKVLIATNKYHVFRAKLLAKRVGMMPYGLPAKIPPTVVFKSYAREYFAVIKSLIYDRV